MKDIMALIITALLLLPVNNILGFDRTILSVPLDEMRLISSLIVFFVFYQLVRWLMAIIID